VRRHLATLAIAVVLTLVGGAAWAYWTADSAPGSNGAAAATSVNQGATPTASAAGATVTVSWSASTLANGQAVNGYLVKRYDAGTLAAQTILSACTGTIVTTSCAESNVPNGSWKYTVTPVFATNWQGQESAKSATVTVSSDSTPPTNAISLSSVTGGAYLTGTTIFYRGAAAGSLRLTNAVADAGSGPASSQTAALTGTSTGWTHTPSTVSTPAGGPYVSNAFDWTAGTTSGPGEAVTGRDVAGNTAVTNLTFTNDSTAPTAGTITYADGYSAGRSISVTFTTGTDADSGIATRRLQRAAATLTGTSCGSFGAFADLGAVNPSSPYVDGSLAVGCYKYRYVVVDRVGNQDVATSASVVKIGYAAAVDATTGLLSHWRLGEGAAALTATDSFTGTSGSDLAGHNADLGGTWVHQAGSAEAVIDGGRIRRNLTTFEVSGYTIDYVNATPTSADYSVEADLDVMSNLASDTIGVIGRLNTTTTSFYLARWEQALVGTTGVWRLVRYSGGTATSLAVTASQAQPVVGETYRLKLEMVGSALALYVNGVLKVSASDATITAAGKAGVMDGADITSGGKTTATGLQIDDFQVTPSTYPRAVDSRGTNTGDYKNGVTLGVSGAIVGGANTAASFDGVNDYVQMTNTTGFPSGANVRSTELWFKTTSSARQVLFRYGAAGSTQEYGLWIDALGATMTAWGFGNGNDKIFTMPSAVNNGAWHQVVETYDGTSITLYIDGVALPAQAATRATTMDMYGFGIGAIIRPSDGNSGGFFSGSIDEVSFYTSVLSQTTVTDHYQLGLTASLDLSGPTGGSVDATGLVGTGARYSTSTTLSLALAKGTDPSGVATTGNQVLRATATLTGGSCGTFGSYSLISGGTDPSSPKGDTVTDQACYSYQYVVLDTLGNATTYTSPDIKVDTTAPSAPALAFSAFTNTYWSGSGSTVYYRSAAASGSVTATATSTDATSGILSYAIPALGTNWTSTPGALGVNTYSWSAAPAAPGTKNVTATNNASLVSANAPFTMTADDTAPTAGTVSYVDGSTTGSTVSVSFTTGTDAGSGIGTRLLQRAAAPLTGITCGTYGAFTTVTNGTNPTSPVTDTISAGSCYKYQYVVSDQVGNQHVATSANVAHTAFGAYWTFDQGTGTSATDSSGNGNTGTLQAAASWTTGNVGPYAVNLTGATNSFVSTPAPVIDSSQSYSVSAWVKPSSITGNNKTIVAIDGSAISPFYLQIAGGQYGFALRGSDSTASALTTANGVAATVGTWTHLVAVHDDTANTVSLYVDGVLKGTTSFNSPWKATGATTVGRAKWNGLPVDFFSGAIDDVHLYDRVLTPTEVTQLAADPSYLATVSATSGLVNHFRLGESTTSADSMAGTAGATLQSRNGETAATWTKVGFSDGDALLTDAGRLRKGGTGTWGTLYYASAQPASPDYTVEADVYVRSNLTSDMAGVVGRLDTSSANGTYYLARYEQAAQKWILYKRLNGSWDWLGESTVQALTPLTTYRLALDMTGTTIRLLVDGAVRVSATDAGISGAGRGGVSFGFGAAATTVTNTDGLHVDNFRISPQLADSKGTNHGGYFGGVTLGATGAVSGDSNTAATFDGVNDTGSVARQVSDDFSIEFWFKSTQGIGTGTDWWSGAGLVDAETAGASNDFGVSLRSDGRVVAGVGTPDVSVVSTSGGYNNGAWHYVVFTRTKSSGALALYIDGVAAGTGTGSTASLTSSTTITFGRIQSVGSTFYAGSLDEIALYSTPLSAATVSAHYTAAQ